MMAGALVLKAARDRARTSCANLEDVGVPRPA